MLATKIREKTKLFEESNLRKKSQFQFIYQIELAKMLAVFPYLSLRWQFKKFAH